MKKIKIRGIIGLDEMATPEYLGRELSIANGDDIEVSFSSPGGFVTPGLEMSNMIRDYPGKTTAILDGLAASMSSYLPMVFDETVVADNAILMIHNPRSGVFGADYRGAEKFFFYIKNLRNMLAEMYISKTGIEKEKIYSMMDDETFLFGKEIVEKGFANRVKESGKKENKESAVAVAMSAIEDCNMRLKSDAVKAADDYTRAAAMLGTTEQQPAAAQKPAPQPTPTTPAAAGNNNKEAAKMKNLKELLAENPEAKAEFDKAVSEAQAAGAKAGEEKMNVAFAAAIPILSSANYPDSVKERVTAKATAGDIDGLKDFVALHDMTVESMKQKGAQAEQPGETPPAQPEGLSEDGSVENAAQLAAATASFKKNYGIGEAK